MTRVTLTFDNGPDPDGTPAALRALADRKIRALFFVVGQKAQTHPELISRTHAEGHLIGNHTWSHSIPFGESSEAGFARAEIEKTQRIVGGYTSTPPLFRPMGAGSGGTIDRRLLNDEAFATLVGGGYTMVLWNVVPRDWERPFDWMADAVEACRGTEHAVIVLHDGHPAGMTGLPAFLDALRDGGTQFTTTLPDSCTPIRAGVPDHTAASLVANPHHQERANLR